MARVAVVGANGFVGRYVVRALLQQGHQPLAVCRQGSSLPAGAEVRRISDYGDRSQLCLALRSAQAVIHVAGRAHRATRTIREKMDCERANAEQPLLSARAALDAGISRFVFVSSVAVHGLRSEPGQALTASSPWAPIGAYALAKVRAERGLRAIEALQLTCVRPPLVYASDAPGNFARLLKLIATARVLPLGAVNNQRSLVAAENLAALLVRAALVAAPPPRALVAGDEPAMSSRELTSLLARAMGKRLVQIRVPPHWLRRAASAVGQGATASKLLDNLVVSAAEAREQLGHQPVVRSTQALEDAARGYWRDRFQRASPSS